jgi:hypothetical protein
MKQQNKTKIKPDIIVAKLQIHKKYFFLQRHTKNKK